MTDLDLVEAIVDRSAESAVLGAVLLAHLDGTDLMPDLMEVLRPEDFWLPFHENVWRAMVSLWEGQEPLDAVAVSARTAQIESQRMGDRAPRAVEVFELLQATPTWTNATYYARIVADLGTKRALANAGTRIIQLAHGAEDGQFLVEQSRDMLERAVRGGAEVRSLHEDFVEFAHLFGTQQLGYPTPWKGLSEALGGFAPGRFYVVGSRPGTGKSILAAQVAWTLSRDGAVALSSLEMTRRELLGRFTAMMGEIRLERLLGLRPLDEQDRRRIAAVGIQVRDVPVFIDDRSSVTPTAVGSHARSVTRQHGRLAGVIVDYLQLMGSNARTESRQQEVSDLSRSLKLLAKDLDAPVIALAQLNRDVEKRVGKTPVLADLRESGGLEADADVVMLLSMDVESDPETGQEFESTSVVRMHVAKNRHGPLALLRMEREGHFARLREIQSLI